MHLNEILQKLDIKLAKDADATLEISDVCHDSRSVTPGALFVAIKGAQSDGHDHIASAVEKGAVCVICEREPSVAVPYVIVEDSRVAHAIASACHFGNAHEKLKIIGVTGTNGKTTTTSIIKQMLEQLTEKPVGLIGSVGDYIGDAELVSDRATPTTPDAYDLHRIFAQMVDAGCEYAVMEVSSHALSLGRVAGITFEVSVFTNLTQDHLDFHATIEKYADAKAKIVNQSNVFVANMDDAYFERMTQNAQVGVLAYSTKNNAADIVARQIKLNSSKVDFCALMTGNLVRTELAIPGLFSVYNALAAMLTVRALGFELDVCATALTKCVGVKGRAEVVPTERDFTILIDYAHTPDALDNIISAVREVAEGRVVTLFGCGGDRDRTKRPIMGGIAARLSDFVVVTSDNPRTEDPNAIIAEILTGMAETTTPYEVVENRREAIAYAMKHAQPNDTIILAGKGHETYQEINHVKHHLDEREVVAEILTEL